MSLILGSSEDQRDRNIQINRGVYALGLAVLQGDAQRACRIALEEMQGMDWVEVPYSLARAMHTAVDFAVQRRMSYLAGKTLTEFDEKQGVLKLSELGTMAMKKLGSKISRMG